MANTATPNTAPVTATPAPTPTGSTTLVYRRQHPGGGPLGRCSYGVPGLPGIVVFDMGLFANGIAPATLQVVGMVAAAPQARRAAGVTSAVVAAANVAQAQAAQAPAIAPPAQVAQVAAATGAKVVAAAATKGTPKGHTAKVG